jgi:hypothetical protein
MSDTPKFTVVDRRKFRADDDSAPNQESTPEAKSEPVSSEAPKSVPRLTLVEPVAPKLEPVSAVAIADEPQTELENPDDPQLPPPPSEEELRFQMLAYEQAAERIDTLIRAQNPAAPPAEKIGFEHLVQQLYLSAMMQMGAGTPEGQRPRIDILGARQTIDLLGVVEDKTQGKLYATEARTLEAVLFELRATFLELTRMISAQPAAPMPPPPGANPGPRR